MFVQVFQGPVSDPARVKAQLDRWVAELAPSADGWLGSTSGVTGDGMFVTLARFESEEAARRNSDRPEQGAWWQQMAELFTSEPEFRDSTHVEVDEWGDLDSAGFVQVIQGRSSDLEKDRELLQQQDDDAWREHRPDVLGSVNVEHEGGEWTTAVYFTNEEEARAGERREPPEQVKAAMEQMQALAVGEPTYLDLKEPWLASPA